MRFSSTLCAMAVSALLSSCAGNGSNGSGGVLVPVETRAAVARAALVRAAGAPRRPAAAAPRAGPRRQYWRAGRFRRLRDGWSWWRAVDGSPAGGDDGAAGVPDAPTAMPPAPGACAKLFATGAISEWVHYDAEGKLVYKPFNASGDRIMDFSHAGYMGGGVAIPTVPVAVTIGPSGGDDTAGDPGRHRHGLAHAAGQWVPGRGAARPGAYRSASTINITASGVVLRGSGAG